MLDRWIFCSAVWWYTLELWSLILQRFILFDFSYSEKISLTNFNQAWAFITNEKTIKQHLFFQREINGTPAIYFNDPKNSEEILLNPNTALFGNNINENKENKMAEMLQTAVNTIR